MPKHGKFERGSSSKNNQRTTQCDPAYSWSFAFAFVIFSTVNCTAAVYAPIQDCDEVFNYWEPTHYINHGYGLQTWEYSPEYAIRSWLYILIHALPGRLSWIFFSQKFSEFTFIRFILGIVCAISQLELFKAVSKSVGSRVAFIMLFAMASSTGMFYASVAYLPSSFSMYTTMMGIAAFLDVRDELNTTQGIMWFGIGAIVGWPFSAALILPLSMDELASIKLTRSIKGCFSRVFRGIVTALPIIVSVTYLSIATMSALTNTSSSSILLSMRSSFVGLPSLHGVSSRIMSSAARQGALTYSALSPGIFMCATLGSCLHYVLDQSFHCSSCFKVHRPLGFLFSEV